MHAITTVTTVTYASSPRKLLMPAHTFGFRTNKINGLLFWRYFTGSVLESSLSGAVQLNCLLLLSRNGECIWQLLWGSARWSSSAWNCWRKGELNQNVLFGHFYLTEMVCCLQEERRRRIAEAATKRQQEVSVYCRSWDEKWKMKK